MFSSHCIHTWRCNESVAALVCGYLQYTSLCTARLLDLARVVGSQLSVLQDDALDKQSLLHVRFDEPQKAVTPEQALVMYDGDVCLGSALVQHSGPTLFETDWEKS